MCVTQGLKPMTYFAKMFPIEKGYSSNLFDYDKDEGVVKAEVSKLWYCRRVMAPPYEDLGQLGQDEPASG